jgi:hypothetical protein
MDRAFRLQLHRLVSALRVIVRSGFKPVLTFCCVAVLCGCAAIPRRTTLTDLKTGEVCYGGFNLISRQGWVVLPDGAKLTGKIVGTTDQLRTRTAFSGTATAQSRGVTSYGSFEGTGTSITAPTRGEGWALLKSADGTKIMEISVVSNGQVTAGFGDAVMNDGRRFKVVW